MNLVRVALLLGLLVPIGARSEPAGEASLAAYLPADAVACLEIPSVPTLTAALRASPVYAKALDGTWEQLGRILLQHVEVPVLPTRTAAWDVLAALAPELKGPAALAWLKEGPVAFAPLEDSAPAKAWLAARKAVPVCVAFPKGWIVLAATPALLDLQIRALADPPRDALAASPAWRRAAPEPGAHAFLYASPGTLAASGRLGERLRTGAEERPPFGEGFSWSCRFDPDGVADTLRLLRPRRAPLLPPASGRLVQALPANAALTLSGQADLARLREVMACALGRDLFTEDGLAEACAGWKGEFALSFGWTFVMPDLLLGVEVEDPKAVAEAFLIAVEARGGKRSGERAFSLPDWPLPGVVQTGDRAVWIATNPLSAVQAAGARPAPREAPGLRMQVKLPDLFGPLGMMVAQQGADNPAAALLQAKASWTVEAVERDGMLAVTSRAPWGLMPLLAACGLGLDALGTFPVAEEPRAVADRVEKDMPGLRGLPFKAPLDVLVVTPEETQDFFRKAFDKEMPPEKMASTEEGLRAFGLLRADQGLRSILLGGFIDLVGGFYDPETKGLYLIRNMPAQSVVAAHEITHALQDQHYDLAKLQKDLQAKGADADRDAALLAVIEGDATMMMEDYMRKGMAGNPAALVRMLLEILSEPRLAALQIAALQDIPEAVLRQMMFSYEDGKDFVQAVRNARGMAGVDALFKDPPASTEQVLHPEKFLGATRDIPTPVTLPPPPPGWTRVAEDTLGELGTQAMLRTFLPNDLGDRAAAGWDGDRYAIDAKGTARRLVWRTVWDTPEDAEEFRAAAEKAWLKRGLKASILIEGTRVEFVDAAPIP